MGSLVVSALQLCRFCTTFRVGSRANRRGALCMFQSLSLRKIILIVGLMMVSGGVVAEPENIDSANFIMPGCRDNQPADNSGYFKSGICYGKVSALAYMQKESCFPRGVTDGQKVRVIVAYIDARPSRLHEDFRILALEAMKAAWPCKR
jgi:hypothetical protein